MNLKFRAWNNAKNHMAVVDAIDFFSEKVTLDHQKFGRSYEVYIASFDDVILMQNTGFLDKNGTDIYEGDIVRLHSSEELKGEVIWIDGGYLVKILIPEVTLFLIDKDIEIIGNIYETPSE